MEQQEKEVIFRALKAKNAVPACPRCKGTGHDLVGYNLQPVHDTPRVTHEPPPAVPTVLMLCVKCGNLTQHVLSSLGVQV